MGGMGFESSPVVSIPLGDCPRRDRGPGVPKQMEQVNTNIPVSCDPGVVDTLAPDLVIGHNDAGPIHDPSITTARAIFTGLSESAALLGDAQAAIKAAGLNDPTTRERASKAAGSHMTKAGKLVADGLAAIDARAAQVQVDIDDVHLNIGATRLDINENARAGEVRSYLRSLPKSERLETIRKAITVEKDRAVAAAILSASPLAVGLSSNDVQGLRMDAERVFAPDQVRIRDGIAKVRTSIETAGAAITKRYGEMIGIGDSPAARAARSLAALEGGAA
tara:strand:+ start:171571 stop:172404 length:834 start_codon:yes stop_codon:yes gene_type:complete